MITNTRYDGPPFNVPMLPISPGMQLGCVNCANPTARALGDTSTDPSGAILLLGGLAAVAGVLWLSNKHAARKDRQFRGARGHRRRR